MASSQQRRRLLLTLLALSLALTCCLLLVAPVTLVRAENMYASALTMQVRHGGRSSDAADSRTRTLTAARR